MVILVVLACLAMLGGAIFYNPLRRRMAGIIGVGGAYIVLIGVMLVIMCIGQLFGAAGAAANGTEIVMSVVFMVLALGYMVFILLYFPCIATFVAIKNETGKWRWAIACCIYTMVIAWVMAFLAFRIGILFY